MLPLDIFTPTKIRDFTYYDRCAIRLDPDEMKAVRLRINVTILATPVYRSLNFKYPYSKEFYGYGQAFMLNSHYKDFAINYQTQYIWDYWNQHGLLAWQAANVIQKLAEFCAVSIDFQKFVLPSGDSGDGNNLDATKAKMLTLAEGFTVESTGDPNDGVPQNDVVQTFNHPFDLLRFKFPTYTVFSVAIESWQLGNTGEGSSYGPPETDAPYDATNPNGNSPASSGSERDPENPYGDEPPDSSPLDPTLDPSDFSNAPPPPTPGEGECLRIFGDVQIAGLDGAPRQIDLTFGPYPSGFTTSWEAVGQTSQPPIQTLYNATVRGAGGVLIDYPFTGDLLRAATFQRVQCPSPP